MVERISELCRQNGISFAALERKLNFANGSLKKTDDKAQVWRIKAIADYFGVSMEYILTGKDKKEINLSNSEIDLLTAYRTAPESRRESVRVLLNILERGNGELRPETVSA